MNMEESKMKFKVGNRVKSTEFGKGTVVEENGRASILVKFDNTQEGLHDGNGISKRKYKKNTCWWYLSDTRYLELIEKYTYEDLRKSPIGTKITFENGRVFVRAKKNCIGAEFTDIDGFRGIDNLHGLKDSWLEGYYGKIIKIEEPTYKTVYEDGKEILDEVEKKYLSLVISPFKNKVKTITKISKTIGDKAYIKIFLINNDICNLPDFEINTMYKGMEADKEYTLKELGL